MADTQAADSADSAIRETAYLLWEQDGRPEGRDQEFWYRAEQSHARDTVNDLVAAQPRP